MAVPKARKFRSGEQFRQTRKGGEGTPSPTLFGKEKTREEMTVRLPEGKNAYNLSKGSRNVFPVCGEKEH